MTFYWYASHHTASFFDAFRRTSAPFWKILEGRAKALMGVLYCEGLSKALRELVCIRPYKALKGLIRFYRAIYEALKTFMRFYWFP